MSQNLAVCALAQLLSFLSHCYSVFIISDRVWVVDWVGGWVAVRWSAAVAPATVASRRPGFRCALRGRGGRSPADTHPGIKPAAEERAPRISTSPTPTESRKMQTAHAVSTNTYNAALAINPLFFPNIVSQIESRSLIQPFL